MFEITPEALKIKTGTNLGSEILWSDDDDLLDMLWAARKSFPRMPYTGCEGGVVLIGLGVDGGFDQVVTAQPRGQVDRADLAEQMLSIRDVADDCARALDAAMSGTERQSASDLFREQAQQIQQALALMLKVADDDRCPSDVREEAAALLQQDGRRGNHMGAGADTKPTTVTGE